MQRAEESKQGAQRDAFQHTRAWLAGLDGGGSSKERPTLEPSHGRSAHGNGTEDSVILSSGKITTSAIASTGPTLPAQQRVQSSGDSERVESAGKRWSPEYRRMYERETDPQVKEVLREMGADLPMWISEEEVDYAWTAKGENLQHLEATVAKQQRVSEERVQEWEASREHIARRLKEIEGQSAGSAELPSALGDGGGEARREKPEDKSRQGRDKIIVLVGAGGKLLTVGRDTAEELGDTPYALALEDPRDAQMFLQKCAGKLEIWAEHVDRKELDRRLLEDKGKTELFLLPKNAVNMGATESVESILHQIVDCMVEARVDEELNRRVLDLSSIDKAATNE